MSNLFILSPDRNSIYDVLEDRNSGNICFSRINITTQSVDKLTLVSELCEIKAMNIDEQSGCIYLYTANGRGYQNNEPVVEQNVYCIDPAKMTFRKMESAFVIKSKSILAVFSNGDILTSNMKYCAAYGKSDEIDIGYSLRTVPQGYLIGVSAHCNGSILSFIYSDGVDLLDLKSGKMLMEFRDIHCSCVMIENSEIVIGTWDKVIYYDNVDARNILHRGC
jgi:hypothetical protein